MYFIPVVETTGYTTSPSSGRLGKLPIRPSCKIVRNCIQGAKVSHSLHPVVSSSTALVAPKNVAVVITKALLSEFVDQNGLVAFPERVRSSESPAVHHKSRCDAS